MITKIYEINNQNLDNIWISLESEYFIKAKIVLIVGSAGSGKSKLLRTLLEIYRDGILINFGLELSKKLIENKNIDFYDAVNEILGDYIKVYLDNVEILSDPYINKDPIGELLNIAKTRQVVATLTGEINKDILYYLRDRRFPIKDLKDSIIINIKEG